ncbi:unnamed protein product, partial [Penicillium bialowiezense]
MGLDELDVVDSRKPSDDQNYITSISELKTRFASPDSTGINCLDITNPFGPGAPAQVNRVDALRIALWNGIKTLSKARSRDHETPAPREFWLVSSKDSISPIHIDTTGQLTYIVGVSGCKTWYMPEQFDVAQTLTVMKEYGSENPSAHAPWIKIDINPGDLL